MVQSVELNETGLSGRVRIFTDKQVNGGFGKCQTRVKKHVSEAKKDLPFYTSVISMKNFIDRTVQM